MKSLRDISETLRSATSHRAMTQAALRAQAGIAQRTLTNVLSGNEDYKVSTLLALADKLGLELFLVPKGAGSAVDSGATSEPLVQSHVSAALDRIRSPNQQPVPLSPPSPNVAAWRASDAKRTKPR